MAASMIFSATHHAVVKGFSLLTHSALSLLHRNRGTITYGPVSYTHLDVYKRQGHSACRR